MSLRRAFFVAVSLWLTLVVAGCKVNSINYFPPHPANVRVVNLIAAAPAIDVAIGGNVAFGGVAFQSLTAYQSYDNQVTSFSVSFTGATTPLMQFSYSLAGNQSYTLVLTGSSTQPVATLLADLSSTNNNVLLIPFNGAINTSSVDIYVTTPGADITTLAPNFGGLQYNAQSRNAAFAAGTYQIRVTPNAQKSVLYDSGPIALDGNAGYGVVLYSSGSGALVNVALLKGQGPSTISGNRASRIKVLSAAPGTAAVSMLLDGSQIVASLGYGGVSTYNEVPAGSATVSFQASATPGATIAAVATTLVTGGDHTAFVSGVPGAQKAYVLRDLNVPPLAGNSRLRFVNASSDAGPVNVLVNGVAQASGLAAGTASAYVEVVGGTVAIVFNDATTGLPVVSLPSVVLTAGQTSTVYVIGPAAALSGVVTQDN